MEEYSTEHAVPHSDLQNEKRKEWHFKKIMFKLHSKIAMISGAINSV